MILSTLPLCLALVAPPAPCPSPPAPARPKLVVVITVDQLRPDYFDRFRPAYRYGFESAAHHMGRSWDEAESDLRRGWDSYEHRGEGQSTWDEIKEAVRDAWERITGASTAKSEERRPQVRE